MMLPGAAAGAARRRRGGHHADAQFHRHRPDGLAWSTGRCWRRGSANSATPPICAGRASCRGCCRRRRCNLGFLIALALVLAYGFWGRLTRSAASRRASSGSTPRFCRGGRHRRRAVVFVEMMLVSGAIGGLAGGMHALGLVHRFVAGFSPGYGFTGIAIALLARNSAVGMLRSPRCCSARSPRPGPTIQLFSDVPIEIVEILQGAVMIFAVAQSAGAADGGRDRRLPPRRRS